MANTSNQFIKFPKVIQGVRSSFGRWLNNWLSSCIAAQPKSTTDIRVETKADGSYLYLTNPINNKSNLEYLYKNNWTDVTYSETYAERRSRLDALVTANGTDAPVYDADLGYKAGQVVRVLATTEYISVANYPEVDWSGSVIYSKITDGKYYLNPGTYVAVADIPVTGSQTLYSLYENRTDGLRYFARNPKVIYAPVLEEPKINAGFFISGSNRTASGSKFEDYQGRYWECIGLFATGSTAAGGMIFKGQWSAVTTYKAQNVVAYSVTGSNAGSYVANVDIATTGSSVAPYIGSPNWTMLGSFTTDRWY